MISSSKPLPDLLNFSKEELAMMDEEMKVKLIPEWYGQKKKAEEQAKSAAVTR